MRTHNVEVCTMIDFTNIEKYKENNRIEAKKAIGGLPRSIWETYSAFANTLGGIILLGVEEHDDKSLHPVDLPEPEKLIKDFWNIVNNANKVSANILSDKDVTIENIDGKHEHILRLDCRVTHHRPDFFLGTLVVPLTVAAIASRKRITVDIHGLITTLRARYTDSHNALAVDVLDSYVLVG